jgi:tetratricopeptide (TPR) repeat protein
MRHISQRLNQGISIAIVVVLVILVVWIVPLNQINTWFAANETIIKVVGGILTGLGGVLTWLNQKRARQRLRVEHDAFEIIRPSERQSAVAAIFKGDAEAANIPYQALGREGMSDVTETLSELLKRHRCLLVRGPAGTGKTREIAQLVKKQCANGWTILVYKGGWISKPPHWPHNIPNQRVLIVLEDMHHHCTPEIWAQHPKAAEWGDQTPLLSFQEALHQYLAFLEAPALDEIRIIATTRSEEPYWSKLDFGAHSVWKRFHYYDLPKLTDETLVHLLEAYADQQSVLVEDPFMLIRYSDGMAQTIVGNVNQARNEEYELTQKNWSNSADQSWQEVYERVISRVPLASDLYDAAHLVRGTGAPLVISLVLAVAEARMKSRWFTRYSGYQWGRWINKQGWLEQNGLRYCLRKSLHALVKRYELWPVDSKYDRLTLRDGLLEGKSDLQNIEAEFLTVATAILNAVKKQPKSHDVVMIVGSKAITISSDIAIQLMSNSQYQNLIPATYIISARAYLLKTLHSQQPGTIIFSDTTSSAKAIQQYSKVLELEPKNLEALVWRATLYMGVGKYTEAIQDHTKTLELGSINVTTLFVRAVLYRLTGAYTEAIQDYSKALELEPKNVGALIGRAAAFIGTGAYTEAIRDYSKALELEPQNTAALVGQATVFMRVSAYTEAIQDYSKALELEPQNTAALVGRATVFMRVSAYTEAIQDYSKALELEPKNVGALIFRAAIFMGTGKYTEAIQDYSKILELEPKNVGALIGRAAAFMGTGKYAEAIQDYSKILELEPQNTAALVGRAAIFMSMRKYTEAIQDYSKILELEPQNTAALVGRAAAFMSMRKYTEAIQDYSKILELEPQNTAALVGRAAAFMSMRKYTEAIQDYSKILELEPQNTAALVGRAITYRLTDAYTEAIQDYSKILELDSSATFDVHIGLAASHKLLGHGVEAQKHLQQAYNIQAYNNLTESKSFYIAARLASIEGKTNIGLSELAKAASLADFDHEWARLDPDLEQIRKSARFWEIVRRDNAVFNTE